jgi:hypothetical protein
MASNADRAATLVRAVEAGIEGDSSVIADLYTDDVRGSAPALAVSCAAELAVEVEDRGDTFSDIELTVSPLDVAGDYACVEWSATMTHSGPLTLVNNAVIEATGLRFTLTGVTVAEFRDDRICAFRQYWDEARLLDQLGLLPEAD